jgi:uncharacterized protein (DUF58 family)
MTLLLRLRQRISEGFRHRVTLLGAMVLALLLSTGMLAFTTAQNAFFLLFSLLLASVMVSSFVNRLMLAGLTAEIELPPHAAAGNPLHVRFRLRNNKSWLASFALEVIAPQGSRFHLPLLSARGASSSAFSFQWPSRGRQAPMDFHLETRFPFGFSIRRAKVRVNVPGELYPPLTELPGHREVLEEILKRQRAERLSGAEEFSHLRGYQAGDAARQIAWAASARLAALEAPLVRVNTGESGAGLRIRLDLATPHFEAAVQLAAYLVWELQHRNEEFVFLSGHQEFPVLGPLDAYTVLKHLANVAADPSAAIPHDHAVYVLTYRPGFLPAPGAIAGAA